MAIMDTAKQIFVGVGDLMMGVEPAPTTTPTGPELLATRLVQIEADLDATTRDFAAAVPGPVGPVLLVVARWRRDGRPIDRELCRQCQISWGAGADCGYPCDDSSSAEYIAIATTSTTAVEFRERTAAIDERLREQAMTPIERARLEARAAHSAQHNAEVRQGMRDRSADASGAHRVRGEYRVGSSMSHLRQNSGPEASRLGAVTGLGGKGAPDPRAAALARVRAAQHDAHARQSKG